MKTILGISGLLLCLLMAGCSTTGGGTRTSGTVYQPTDAKSVQILFERPQRPYEVIGQVSSMGGGLASDDAMYRALQKEAAELGAHAVLVQNSGVDFQDNGGFGGYKKGKALAIRFTDGYSSGNSYAVTPTNISPTTPQATQIIPQNYATQPTPQAVPQSLPVAEKTQGTDSSKVYFYSPFDSQKRVLALSKEYSGKQATCPYTGKMFLVP